MNASSAITAEAPVILDSFTHLPNNLGDPIIYGASVAVAAAGSYLLWRLADPERNPALAHNPSNLGLVREATIDVASGEDRGGLIRDRFYRMGSKMLMFAGVVLAVGVIEAGPSFVTTSTTSGADVMVVLDSAASMQDTLVEPKVSRLDKAVDELDELNFDGNLGLDQFGVNNYLNFSAQAFDPSFLNNRISVGLANVDSLGANLADAMTTAANGLPMQQGTEVVITDGVGVSSSISSTVSSLKRQGTQTKFVMVGKPDTFYSVNSEGHYASGVNTNFLAGVPEADIEPSTDSIQAAIQSAVGQPIKEKTPHTWYPAFVLPAAVYGWGLARGVKQLVRKAI